MFKTVVFDTVLNLLKPSQAATIATGKAASIVPAVSMSVPANATAELITKRTTSIVKSIVSYCTPHTALHIKNSAFNVTSGT